MKIVIDKAIPFISGILEPYAEVIYIDGAAFTPEEVRDADALIIRTRTHCNKALLEGTKVQHIATATIGFDHIDLDYCRANNITVSTSSGCNARGVLQWISAALATLAKRENFCPEERTIGIVGVGNVGSLVKEYAEAWGFKTVCCDPPREEREKLGFVTLEDVLKSADIVTLHTPLDATTHHLINSENIALLHSGATLINASRGEVLATNATQREDISYAIDVWENEPNIDKALLNKALVATPHIAGYSRQGKANATAMAVEAIARHFNLPLCDWYPQGVQPSAPHPISWQEMCETITGHCNLRQESDILRSQSENFEHLRNNYLYREEYF